MNMSFARLLSIAGLLGLAAAGCRDGGSGEACGPPPIVPAPFEGAALPETLRIGGHGFTLLAEIWRDFMPGFPSADRPMIADATLLETDSLAIPPDVEMDVLWVIRDTLAWAVAFSGEARPPAPAFQIEKVARCGPRWDPGEEVQAVVRLRAGGQEYLLARRDLVIQRVE
jgi:hypothetical protein